MIAQSESPVAVRRRAVLGREACVAPACVPFQVLRGVLRRTVSRLADQPAVGDRLECVAPSAGPRGPEYVQHSIGGVRHLPPRFDRPEVVCGDRLQIRQREVVHRSGLPEFLQSLEVPVNEFEAHRGERGEPRPRDEDPRPCRHDEVVQFGRGRPPCVLAVGDESQEPRPRGSRPQPFPDAGHVRDPAVRRVGRGARGTRALALRARRALAVRRDVAVRRTLAAQLDFGTHGLRRLIGRRLRRASRKHQGRRQQCRRDPQPRPYCHRRIVRRGPLCCLKHRKRRPFRNCPSRHTTSTRKPLGRS